MTRNIYLALGDSITAGYGANHPGLGFVGRVGKFAMSQKLATEVLMVARNGWTTKDIWNATRTIHPRVWERTALLTLLTGGNDLRKLLRTQYFSPSPISPQMISARLDEFEFYMDRLCDFLSQKGIPWVTVATVYNPVPNYALGVEAIRGINEITRGIATRYKFPVVDIYEGFLHSEKRLIENYRSGRLEDLISPFRRPIHPNNNGHQQIADLITEELMKITRLSKPRKRNDTVRRFRRSSN